MYNIYAVIKNMHNINAMKQEIMRPKLLVS